MSRSTNRWNKAGSVCAGASSRLLEYMRGMGLRLYIEPADRFESNEILTLDDGLRMVREIDDPQLGTARTPATCMSTGRTWPRAS